MRQVGLHDSGWLSLPSRGSWYTFEQGEVYSGFYQDLRASGAQAGAQQRKGRHREEVAQPLGGASELQAQSPALRREPQWHRPGRPEDLPTKPSTCWHLDRAVILDAKSDLLKVEEMIATFLLENQSAPILNSRAFFSPT